MLEIFIQYQTYILSGALAVLLAVLAWFVAGIARKVKLLAGDHVKTPENLVADLVRRVAKMEAHWEELGPWLERTGKISRASVQKIGFLRFNPFGDTGGDQSFIVALLDGENNGFVLSSLYTRTGVRTYAKEIRKGASRHPLSDEETSVLAQAMKE